MRIPQVIREHQANVMSNISLVREFGLMIEELKVLKPRAMSLGLVERCADDLYELINSMIDLADQEAEDPAIQRLSPPSSPGFDMTGFDDPSEARAVRTSARSVSATAKQETVVRTPPNSRNKRKSVLPLDSDVFTSPASQQDNSRHATPLASTATSRPRKDSEAMARSVIEALKKKKSASDPSLSLHPVPTNRRVQFDTRTLRHIVPYVSGLVRRVKEQIREAEGFDTDGEVASNWDDPDDDLNAPLKKLFRDPSPGPDSPSSRKTRALRTNNSKSNEGFSSIDEVNKQMKMMTVM